MPNKNKLEAHLWSVIGAEKLPRFLVGALLRNPEGVERQQLLADIVAKPCWVACRALRSAVTLSASECELLARRSLQVTNYDYLRGRSRTVLARFASGGHQVPDDLRSACLRWINTDYGGWGQLRILKNPEKYFPSSAPMTVAERGSLLSTLTLPGTCQEIAIGNEKDLKVSDEEARTILRHALSQQMRSDQAEKILQGPYAGLLDAPQRQALEDLLPKRKLA
jgi:hypothetical protein